MTTLTRTRSGAALDLRAAIAIAEEAGELVRVRREVDPLLEMPAIMRTAGLKLKPIPAILFENIKGYPGKRAVGNLFAEHGRFSRMCGFAEEVHATKFSYLRALDNPIDPVIVDSGPCQENVVMGPVKVEDYFPPTHGALKVTRRYYQPTLFMRHPETGVINLSLYRCCIQDDGRVTINIRWDQHGGIYLEQAMRAGKPLQVALCIGVPPAVYLAAVAKLPYGFSETRFAGGVLRQPLEMVKCKTVDLEVPAASEIVIEGEIRPPYERGSDGPWPEYLGYLGMEIHPPIVDVTCLTYRNDPIENIMVPGSAPHMLGTGTQAQFFRFLRDIFGEFVVDTWLPPRTVLHHGIVKVRKSVPHHEGLQINVGIAALGFMHFLDRITLVDEDINIYDLAEVDWAIATRCNPAKQLHILPEARTHQNNPIAGVQETWDEPITQAKLIIDATMPWKQRNVQKGDGITFFTRSEWPPVNLEEYLDPADLSRLAKK